MERIDKEAGLNEIAESAAQDPIGRNKDIRRFLADLISIKPPFSIFIDAQWGEGKTFFVKTIHQILIDSNSKIKIAPRPELENFTDELRRNSAEENEYLPFYFNAWENDCDEEPLCSILACMATEHGYSTDKAEANVLGLVTNAIDLFAAIHGLGAVRTTGIVGSINRKNALEAHRSKRETNEILNKCIEAILSDRAQKMVIFIDELDRCRPTFAIKLLEQTKHLRSRDDVILVFSTDKTQLAHALAGIYGTNFDSMRYLERFYDYKFELSHVDKNKYMETLGLERGRCRYDLVTAELIDRIDPSLRECHRLQAFKDIRTPCINFSPDFSGEYVGYFAHACVAPTLIAIQHEDPELWQKIKTGQNPDALYDFAREFSSFLDGANYAIERFSRRPADEVTDKERALLVSNICVALFETDHTSERYLSATDTSVIGFWPETSRKALRDLVLRGRP